MEIAVNGTRLWFDVDGPGLVPDGPEMRERPTLLVVHGGPGSYDHSYLKPYFAELAAVAQVVWVDLRDHGRSARHDPAAWSFEVCADDLAAFCDALGIADPVVLGHSMGGIVAMLLGSRHPGRARALVLHGTMARFDLDRLVAGVRRVAGDSVAELARRSYAGEAVTDAEWAAVFAAFGPRVPSADQLARRRRNPAVNGPGMDRLRTLDIVGQLDRITGPALVCVGALDPITPVAAAEEVVAALPPGLGRLAVLPGAGHFSWLDIPDAYFSLLRDVITAG